MEMDDDALSHHKPKPFALISYCSWVIWFNTNERNINIVSLDLVKDVLMKAHIHKTEIK